MLSTKFINAGRVVSRFTIARLSPVSLSPLAHVNLFVETICLLQVMFSGVQQLRLNSSCLARSSWSALERLLWLSRC